jgi:hypothetical protein
MFNWRADMETVPVIVTTEGIRVVRDDLILGGTKRRVLEPLVAKSASTEFVYASPAYGYAQIALAYSCAAVGKTATVFVAKRKIMHARTAEAKLAGARIVEVPHGYLSNVQAKARAYTDKTGAELLPFGLNTPEFIDGLSEVAKTIPVDPFEVWSVAGSGVLTRALQKAWPCATFHAVRIGHDPDAGRATVWRAQEKFENVARIRPPFPSCDNYDAKAWSFVKEWAKSGALFWNVAA